MAILKEVTITAKTVQEAFEQGKEQLCVSETDDVQFEILQQESKKLFRALPAIVRVFVEGAEPKAPKPEKKPAPATKPAEKPAAAPKSPAKPAAKPAEKPAAKPAEKPAAAETPKPAAQTEPKTAPQNETQSAPQNGQDAQPEAPLIPVEEADYSAQVVKALAMLKEILAQMDLGELEFSVSQNENEAQIDVEGKDASYLIGRRGETMSALQYLVSLSVNRKQDDYYRIMLNVEHYREKREKTLSALATRVAKSAIRSGRSTTLEPMNPYERRIIHSTVQGIEGATSASIGEEPNRRVVIRAVNGKPSGRPNGKPGGSGQRYDRGEHNDRRGGYHNSRDGRDGQRGERSRNNERPRREYVAPRDENGEKRAPKSDVDFGNLYGKIEL